MKIGDKVVTDLGTGFVIDISYDGFEFLIALDGGRRIWQFAFVSCEVADEL